MVARTLAMPKHPDREFHPVATDEEIEAARLAAERERQEAAAKVPELAEHFRQIASAERIAAQIRRGIPGSVVEFVSRPNVIRLDANGLPVGHAEASQAAAEELADVVNEWPGGIYHLGPIDAECAASRMLMRYLLALKVNGGEK